MLIRLTVANFYSIGPERSFDMLPNDRLSKLTHHVLKSGPVDVLKLGVLYGANAAGKTTIVKALNQLRSLVIMEDAQPSITYESTRHRFAEDDKAPITLGVEFFTEGKGYLYAIQYDAREVVAEELYELGFGVKEDRVIFTRRATPSGHKVDMAVLAESTEKNKVVSDHLNRFALEPSHPLIERLAHLSAETEQEVAPVINWFKNGLQIISPDHTAVGLAQRLDEDPAFLNFARDLLSSYDVGIVNVRVEVMSLESYFGKENISSVRQRIGVLDMKAGEEIHRRSPDGNEVSIVQTTNGPVVKRVVLEHQSRGRSFQFEPSEESEGTKRLLDFLPAFYNLTNSKKTFVIDELEASIHPVLLFQLMRKFSHDVYARGQLIITTHESSLLNQDLFRRDEIWFVEKDVDGATDLHSLNEYKEHHTKDIRRGYLNGRYGGIPTMRKLQSLDWHEYDSVA